MGQWIVRGTMDRIRERYERNKYRSEAAARACDVPRDTRPVATLKPTEPQARVPEETRGSNR